MNCSSAWYDNTTLPASMVDKIIGVNGWGRIESASHFPLLKEMVEDCSPTKMADVGCGAGEVGRAFSGIDYCGFDLPHIIDNVAMVVNPKLKYEKFDAYNFDYSVLKSYDLIVCNSFISELEFPIGVLREIIKNTTKNLIIHRQSMASIESNDAYKTYGDLVTVKTTLSMQSITDLLLPFHRIIRMSYSDCGWSLIIGRN